MIDLHELVLSSKRALPLNDLEAIVSTQEDASLESPGVEAHYYRFLFFLCQKIKPEIAVELGTHSGISALCMAEGNPNGVVITVDIVNQVKNECRRANIDYRIHDSLVDANPDGEIDLLFIDTDHDGERCFKEFKLYDSRMAKEGIVFFDDIALNERMIDFWRSFNPAGWIKIELPVHGNAGFGCLIKTPMEVQK